MGFQNVAQLSFPDNVRLLRKVSVIEISYFLAKNESCFWHKRVVSNIMETRNLEGHFNLTVVLFVISEE